MVERKVYNEYVFTENQDDKAKMICIFEDEEEKNVPIRLRYGKRDGL